MSDSDNEAILRGNPVCEDTWEWMKVYTYTMCPRNRYPFYIASYYIKWATMYFLDTQ